MCALTNRQVNFGAIGLSTTADRRQRCLVRVCLSLESAATASGRIELISRALENVSESFKRNHFGGFFGSHLGLDQLKRLITGDGDNWDEFGGTHNGRMTGHGRQLAYSETGPLHLQGQTHSSFVLLRPRRSRPLPASESCRRIGGTPSPHRGSKSQALHE